MEASQSPQWPHCSPGRNTLQPAGQFPPRAPWPWCYQPILEKEAGVQETVKTGIPPQSEVQGHPKSNSSPTDWGWQVSKGDISIYISFREHPPHPAPFLAVTLASSFPPDPQFPHMQMKRLIGPTAGELL